MRLFFSPQVHEKSILLPLLPLLLLADAEPELALWGPLVAAFSMYPLLQRDGLAVAYAACCVLHLTVLPGLLDAAGVAPGSVARRGCARALATVCVAAAVALHAARAMLPPPVALPWLWDRAFVTYAAALIGGAMLYTNAAQWRLAQEHSGAAGAAGLKPKSA